MHILATGCVNSCVRLLHITFLLSAISCLYDMSCFCTGVVLHYGCMQVCAELTALLYMFYWI